MAALVVTPSLASGMADKKGRVGIFPGAATTVIYTARTGFWVGYGFAADAEGGDLEDVRTRFELDVDGKPVPMTVDVQADGGVAVRKTNVADFPEGLAAGWHDFTGRWFDGGRLVLSSRVSIQFVER